MAIIANALQLPFHRTSEIRLAHKVIWNPIWFSWLNTE